jgi:hypothetical protein
VNMLMNLRIPQKARNFLTNLVNNGFWIRTLLQVPCTRVYLKVSGVSR